VHWTPGVPHALCFLGRKIHAKLGRYPRCEIAEVFLKLALYANARHARAGRPRLNDGHGDTKRFPRATRDSPSHPVGRITRNDEP
jgi:hypothetical protein